MNEKLYNNYLLIGATKLIHENLGGESQQVKYIQGANTVSFNLNTSPIKISKPPKNICLSAPLMINSKSKLRNLLDVMDKNIP
jgi:hypothetical protein